MAKVLVIIAPAEYQDVEYKETRRGLEEGGHQVVTASTVSEAHGKLGGSAKADVLLKDIKNGDYAGVVFIGGHGAHIFFDHPSAHRIAQAFNDTHRVTAAICAAPVILANAGILRNKNATCYPSHQADLEEQGAIFTAQPVVRDGHIITASGPEAAYDFGQKVAEAIGAQ
jgi:protease I